MARPFNLKESWNYNLHLSKGNKLRIIIPIIIFLGIVIFGYLFVVINTSYIFSIWNKYFPISGFKLF